MPDQLQLRGGTTTEHNSFTGALREVTVDTTKKTLVVHDGSTQGGTPLMKASGTIDGASVQLGTGGVSRFTIDNNGIVVNEGGASVDFRIEGDNYINLFFVDASSDRIGIGTNAPAAPLHILGTDNNSVFIVESTDADANVGPIIELFRNSASPADNDVIGRLDFKADDDAGNKSSFARIQVTATDVTNNSENARIDFIAAVNDTFNPTMTIVNGLVGIGTNTDAVDRALHVKSAGLIAKLESTSETSAIIFATPNNESAGTIPNIGATTSDLTFTTGNLTRLTVKADGKVGINNTSPIDIFHVKHTNTTIGRFESTATGPTGCELVLMHNSSSPADGDVVSGIYLQGKDSDGNTATYGAITAVSDDVTNGTEDGSIRMFTTNNNSYEQKLRLNNEGIAISNIDSGGGLAIDVTDVTGNYAQIGANANRTGEFDVLLGLVASWNGDSVAQISFQSGPDTSNKDNGKISFFTQGSAAGGLAYRMVIKEDGNIGIGTTNAQTKLHIKGNGAALNIADYPTLTLETDATNGAANTGTGIMFLNHDGNGGSFGGAIQVLKSNSSVGNSSHYMRIATRQNGGSLTTRLTIDDNGKVYMNDVAGDSNAGMRVKVLIALDANTVNYANSGIEIRQSHNSGSQAKRGALISGWDGTIQATAVGQNYDGTGYGLSFATNGNTSDRPEERMFIDRAGVTTITQVHSSQGSTPFIIQRPNAATNVQVTMLTLECGGNARGQLVSGSSGSSAPQLSATSDYRIKENIRDYTDGWNNIKAIPVKIFDVKTDGSKDIKGWVAHEVQPYIPEAVIGEKDAVVTQAMVDSEERDKTELGDDIMQQLAYGAFMPDVVGALQAAIAKIEVLETKVAALEAA